MRELLRKSALLSAIGFAAGMLVGFGFLMAQGIQAILSRLGPGWVLAYLLICSAMGMINVGTMTIYEIERWSLTRATPTHFAITLCTFCGLGLLDRKSVV